jgi:2',3'-cyclic-nucleotide 2'-phosphodiesterase (5'-nucleotidase family)
MSLLKYDAINLAERDLQYGTEFLKNMKNKYDLPFVSANVYYSGTKKLFAKPYIIRERGGLKIGIFGVTDPEEFKDFVKTETGLEISDPISAAQATVDYLRRESDVVIGLIHLALYGARDLAKQVSGIDIIISGHDGMLVSKPERIGKSVLMQPGFQGRYLGHIDFTAASNNIVSIDGKTVILLDKIPDDPEMSKLIQEYDEALLNL